MPRRSNSDQIELDIPRFAVNRLQRIPVNRIVDVAIFEIDEDLAESIHASGILEPIKVERLSGGNFRILDGRRRARIFLRDEIEEIPAIVYGELSAKARAAITLTTNIQRHRNLGAELEAYMELSSGQDMSLAEIADLLRLPIGKLRLYYRLSTLIPPAQRAISQGRINATVASAMTKLSITQQASVVADSTGVITMEDVRPYLPPSATLVAGQRTIALPSTAVNNPVDTRLQRTTDEEGRVHWFINEEEYVPVSAATVVVEQVSMSAMAARETWEGTLRLLEAAYAGMPIQPDDDSDNYYSHLRQAMDACREIARRRSGRYAVPS